MIKSFAQFFIMLSVMAGSAAAIDTLLSGNGTADVYVNGFLVAGLALPVTSLMAVGFAALVRRREKDAQLVCERETITVMMSAEDSING